MDQNNLQRESYRSATVWQNIKERYEPLMQNVRVTMGYISVIHDHRGHGKSVKNASDLGYFMMTVEKRS